MIKEDLRRLIPASQAAAIVAAVVHVIAIAVRSGGIVLESIYIALITYMISVLITLPFGAVLLTLVGFFRLNLVISLTLFIATSLVAVIITTMYFFEAKLTDIPWQYALISIPSSLAAWYFSVYHVYKIKKESIT